MEGSNISLNPTFGKEEDEREGDGTEGGGIEGWERKEIEREGERRNEEGLTTKELSIIPNADFRLELCSMYT